MEGIVMEDGERVNVTVIALVTNNSLLSNEIILIYLLALFNAYIKESFFVISLL